MAKNTIKLKSYQDNIFEKAAASAITPGMLIEPTTADTLQAHSTSEGNAIPIFAVENDLEGNGIDDVYSAADQVQAWIPARGDEVYAILRDGENVVIGDYLASNGDGTLKKHVADDSGGIQVNGIVAQSLEALDLSDSSGGESSGALGFDKRLEVRVA
jgi:hypothetical protein